MKLTHAEAQALVSARLDGPLDPVAERELNSHLATCDSCRAFSLSASRLALDLQNLPYLPASPAVTRAVLDHVSTPRTPLAWLVGSWSSRTLASAGAVALAMIIIAATTFGALRLLDLGDDRAQIPAATTTPSDLAALVAGDDPTIPAGEEELVTSQPDSESDSTSLRLEETGESTNPTQPPSDPDAEDSQELDTIGPPGTNEAFESTSAEPTESPGSGSDDAVESGGPVTEVSAIATTALDLLGIIQRPSTEPGDDSTAPSDPPVDPTATPDPTEEPTATPAPTEEPTAALVPTEEPTATPAPTEKLIPTPEPTEVTTEEPTATPEPTEAPTATPIPTEEPTATPEPTEEPTATPIPTEEPTPTPEPTEVPTEEPTATPVPTEEPTATPVPTEEPTATPVPTQEPTSLPDPTSPPIEPREDSTVVDATSGSDSIDDAPDPTDPSESGTDEPVIESVDGMGGGDDDPTDAPPPTDPTDEQVIEPIIEPVDEGETDGSGAAPDADQPTEEHAQSGQFDGTSGGLTLGSGDSHTGIGAIPGTGSRLAPGGGGGIAFSDQPGLASTTSQGLSAQSDGRVVDVCAGGTCVEASAGSATDSSVDTPVAWLDGELVYQRQNGATHQLEFRALSVEAGSLDVTGDRLLGGGGSEQQYRYGPFAVDGSLLVLSSGGWVSITLSQSAVIDGNPYGTDLRLIRIHPQLGQISYVAGGDVIVASLDAPGQALARVPFQGQDYDLSPGGERIAVIGDNGLTVMNLGGEEVATYPNAEGIAVGGIVWVSDGIFYADLSNGVIRLIQP